MSLPSCASVANRLLAFGLTIAVCACSGGGNKIKDDKQRNEAAELNLQLASDYFRQGELVLAKEKLERSLDQNPRSASAHSAAGLLYDRLGELDKAENHFERAVSLDGQNPEVRNNFAVFLCRHGKYARGEKHALAAISDPLYRTPEIALLNAGYCARGAGDVKKAEQYFRRALATKPRFAPVLLEMAALEYQQKNYMPARAFMERFLSEKQAGPDALWLAVRIEQALGNRSQAGDYARRLTADFPTSNEAKAYLESARNESR